VVLLPEAKIDNALQVAERLRERIEKETAALLAGTADNGVTVSVGVACYPDDGLRKEDLFNKVDALLYKAKELGKNKVYFIKEK
jgi:diguanylate cyclase (GGDEF)-like protein